MTSTEISVQDITALIARWSEAAQLIMNGDLRAYAAIARHAEDYTLLPPHGGVYQDVALVRADPRQRRLR